MSESNTEINYKEAYEREHEKCADLADKIVVLESEKEDCLLYTSPSPRDRSLSRMPSSA